MLAASTPKMYRHCRDSDKGDVVLLPRFVHPCPDLLVVFCMDDSSSASTVALRLFPRIIFCTASLSSFCLRFEADFGFFGLDFSRRIQTCVQAAARRFYCVFCAELLFDVWHCHTQVPQVALKAALLGFCSEILVMLLWGCFLICQNS